MVKGRAIEKSEIGGLSAAGFEEGVKNSKEAGG